MDVAAFLSLAKVGDRLEFQREGYCHWAIYVGEQYIPIDDKVLLRHCWINADSNRFADTILTTVLTPAHCTRLGLT
jgi:hypothetical protein